MYSMTNKGFINFGLLKNNNLTPNFMNNLLSKQFLLDSKMNPEITKGYKDSKNDALGMP